MRSDAMAFAVEAEANVEVVSPFADGSCGAVLAVVTPSGHGAMRAFRKASKMLPRFLDSGSSLDSTESASRPVVQVSALCSVSPLGPAFGRLQRLATAESPPPTDAFVAALVAEIGGSADNVSTTWLGSPLPVPSATPSSSPATSSPSAASESPWWQSPVSIAWITISAFFLLLVLVVLAVLLFCCYRRYRSRRKRRLAELAVAATVMNNPLNRVTRQAGSRRRSKSSKSGAGSSPSKCSALHPRPASATSGGRVLATPPPRGRAPLRPSPVGGRPRSLPRVAGTTGLRRQKSASPATQRGAAPSQKVVLQANPLLHGLGSLQRTSAPSMPPQAGHAPTSVPPMPPHVGPASAPSAPAIVTRASFAPQQSAFSVTVRAAESKDFGALNEQQHAPVTSTFVDSKPELKLSAPPFQLARRRPAIRLEPPQLAPQPGSRDLEPPLSPAVLLTPAPPPHRRPLTADLPLPPPDAGAAPPAIAAAAPAAPQAAAAPKAAGAAGAPGPHALLPVLGGGPLAVGGQARAGGRVPIKLSLSPSSSSTESLGRRGGEER
jgi:hypothetical protein